VETGADSRAGRPGGVYALEQQSVCWDVGDQPPELWSQFKTDFAPGTHVRIHPLLDWAEVDIREYIEREQIPTVGLYFDRVELRSGRLKNVAERSGRLQDGKHGLEELRRSGYM
jgi:sulfate adenylyltransferase subunit 2